MEIDSCCCCCCCCKCRSCYRCPHGCLFRRCGAPADPLRSPGSAGTAAAAAEAGAPGQRPTGLYESSSNNLSASSRVSPKPVSTKCRSQTREAWRNSGPERRAYEFVQSTWVHRGILRTWHPVARTGACACVSCHSTLISDDVQATTHHCVQSCSGAWRSGIEPTLLR